MWLHAVLQEYDFFFLHFLYAIYLVGKMVFSINIFDFDGYVTMFSSMTG